MSRRETRSHLEKAVDAYCHGARRVGEKPSGMRIAMMGCWGEFFFVFNRPTLGSLALKGKIPH